MASMYYVKKDGKFPRALFVEHIGGTHFVFHMPNGVTAAKESHSCLRPIRAGNWKLITKEEAFALKEKKVTQSFPKYYIRKETRPFIGGAAFVKRFSETTYAFIDPDGTQNAVRSWTVNQSDWVYTGLWVEVSEEKALAIIQHPEEEADKLLLPKKPEIPVFKPSGAGVYLTAGGYLVNLDNGWTATVKHSPGLSYSNMPASCGWRWRTDGTIMGLQPEWCEKLRLVEKMPEGFVIPPETDEFVYADGYPMVRLPKKGEYYIPFNALKDGKTDEPILAICRDSLYCEEHHKSVIFAQRKKEMLPKYYIRHNNLKFVNNIAFVERSTDNKRINHYLDGTTKVSEGSWASDIQSYVDDGRWVEISLEQGKQLIAQQNKPAASPITRSGQYELMNGKIVNLTLSSIGNIAHCDFNDNIKAENCHINYSYAWNSNGTIGGIGSPEYCRSFYVKRYIGPLKQESVTAVGTEGQKVTTGEEEMKSETAVAVAKGAGNLALRALNYWAWEPAKNMGGRVLSSIRYVTFFAGITACVLGYNYPTQTKALVKSALPKIHFSVERPELLK